MFDDKIGAADLALDAVRQRKRMEEGLAVEKRGQVREVNNEGEEKRVTFSRIQDKCRSLEM